FGTPTTESIRRTEDETEDHLMTKRARIGKWTVNGVAATEAEFKRASVQALMLNESLAPRLLEYIATRNQNMLDEIVTFRILEYHKLSDGFWGQIDFVTFRNGTQAYRVNINIAPPD